jgi:hypothetical protein
MEQLPGIHDLARTFRQQLIRVSDGITNANVEEYLGDLAEQHELHDSLGADQLTSLLHYQMNQLIQARNKVFGPPHTHEFGTTRFTLLEGLYLRACLHRAEFLDKFLDKVLDTIDDCPDQDKYVWSALVSSCFAKMIPSAEDVTYLARGHMIADIKPEQFTAPDGQVVYITPDRTPRRLLQLLKLTLIGYIATPSQLQQPFIDGPLTALIRTTYLMVNHTSYTDIDQQFIRNKHEWLTNLGQN